MKRFVAFVFLSLLSGSVALAQPPSWPPSCATPGTDNAFLGIQTIRLWQGQAPQAKGDGCYDVPTLTIFDPHRGTANGSAVIILPGGGYEDLAANLEGRQFADWFTARGFRAFVLSYRLPSHGYLLPVPLVDARRAIQLVRARADDYHISANRIVLIGFSAGGHLAALTATQPVPGNPNSEDAIDRVSSRPDYLVLGYPWLGAVSLDYSHLNYCKEFHLEEQCAELTKKYNPELFVSKDMPPTFIYHTFDDRTVPIEQSLSFFEAMVKAGVQTEYHVFASGAHGSGLGKGQLSLEQWPGLLDTWLRDKGLLTVDKMAPNGRP